MTSRNLPELARLKIWLNCGSRPGVVPATRPIDAVGAIAIRVELRMPPATLARSASQSRRVRAVDRDRHAAIGFEQLSSESIGTRPWLQREPAKLR